MNTKQKRKLPKYAAIASTLSLLILFPTAEYVRANLDNNVYKFLSGYLLGTISAMAIESLIHWWRMRKKGGFFASMTNRFERSFLFLLFIVIVIFAGVIWIVSWEGETGVFFGAGMLVAQWLVHIGIGDVLRMEEQNTPKPTSTPI